MNWHKKCIFRKIKIIDGTDLDEVFTTVFMFIIDVFFILSWSVFIQIHVKTSYVFMNLVNTRAMNYSTWPFHRIAQWTCLDLFFNIDNFP